MYDKDTFQTDIGGASGSASGSVTTYNPVSPMTCDCAKKLIKDGKLALSGGTISLQSESHPVEFRKVELKKLD